MDTLIHSAVAGAGLSMGRDVYRKTRDNIVVIVLLAIALAGTAYGFWNMSRGHDRGIAGTVFRTVVANAFIVAISFSVFMTVFMIASGATASRDVSRLEETDTRVLLIGLGVQTALAVTGLAVGLYQRGRRVEAIVVDRDNARFLKAHGFRDVGGREQTMLDPTGTELILDDFRADAIIFKVKGRRGVRAKLELDGDGRMIRYIPA